MPEEVRDLTTEEYDATYAEGEPHGIPADELAAAVAEAELIGAADEEA